MNEKQIHRFIHRYVEATDCRIVEKSPAHLMVKLSPQADRELTNRPYYWSYVDRAGVEPETMTYLFVTDPIRYDDAAKKREAEHAPPVPGSAAMTPEDTANQAVDLALSRSIGFVHSTVSGVRTPREDMYFGSRKLDALFQASRAGGSYVYLFQEPEIRSSHPLESTAYTAWLGVNLRVEYACDMKREEIHSFGVSLATGTIVEQFHKRLLQLRLTPRLPANIHTARNGITLAKAVSIIEAALEKKLRDTDFSWAKGAAKRLEEELSIIAHYYERMLESAEEGHREAVQAQYEARREEIRWQYEPRITASAINCGIFHLEGID